MEEALGRAGRGRTRRGRRRRTFWISRNTWTSGLQSSLTVAGKVRFAPYPDDFGTVSVTGANEGDQRPGR